MRSIRIAALLATGASLLLAAPGSAQTPQPPDPASFSSRIDNPWFPLLRGSTYRYRGQKDGKPAVEVLTVTNKVKRIQGIPNAVIHDRLFLNGKLEERTTDWYSQAADGTVWYFGEATATLDARGHVESREGSFQAGVDGAQGGIFMPAHPKVGQSAQQEDYPGHAEDHFTVVDLSASVSVPFIKSMHALRTTERTPLEPGVLDTKFYVRGIGVVAERQLKGPGPKEILELVDFKR